MFPYAETSNPAGVAVHSQGMEEITIRLYGDGKNKLRPMLGFLSQGWMAIRGRILLANAPGSFFSCVGAN